jgi:hypothetical protein
MKTLLLSLATLALATPALAQIPVGTFVGAPKTGYDSAGRRDPFVSLVAPKRPVGPQLPLGRGTGTGLRSIALADAAVTGIVRRGDAMMAIVQGPNGQSFVAKVKDRLLDAVIKRIDATGVVFTEVVEPGLGVRAQDIRKALRGSVEGSR